MSVQQQADPYNFPMPNRKDLMSLQTIGNGDGMKTTTRDLVTKRYLSQNLETCDITGTNWKIVTL